MNVNRMQERVTHHVLTDWQQDGALIAAQHHRATLARYRAQGGGVAVE